MNGEHLRGAMHSKAETGVHPRSALAALVELIQHRGVEVHFGAPVVRVHPDAVETSDGRRFELNHLVIAAGEEMRLLFPQELARANLARSRLQMMRTAPQPAGFKYGGNSSERFDAVLNYPAFRDCPSTAKLGPGSRRSFPSTVAKWGVHVIAAQHPDGSLVIGDSHEYAADF